MPRVFCPECLTGNNFRADKQAAKCSKCRLNLYDHFIRDKDDDQIESLIDEARSKRHERNEQERLSKISENEAWKLEFEEQQKKQEIYKILQPISLIIFFLFSLAILLFADSFIFRWVGLSWAIFSGYAYRLLIIEKPLGILEIVFWIIFTFIAYSNNWLNIRENTVSFLNYLGIDNELTEIIRNPEQAVISYNLREFEALSCDNVSRHEGENLINVFGRRIEIIRIYDGEQVSRTSTELICNATSFLSSGGGETDLQVKYSLINGEVFLEIQAL